MERHRANFSARLVRLAQEGDPSAFAELYLHERDWIYAYVRQMVRDAHEAEDVTQAVFEQAFEALPRYQLRAGTRVRSWLLSIAHNTALSSAAKRARVEPVEPLPLALEREVRGWVEPWEAGLDATPIEDGPGWIDDEQLERRYERLPVAQRQVLTLGYRCELTTAEIAAVLGRSPTDVRTLRSRGLAALRGRMPASRTRTNL